MTMKRISALVLTCSVAIPAAVARAQEPPRFTSSVEVLSVDVMVVDSQGRPIVDLRPEDFRVRVDNETRRVLTAEWVPLGTAADANAEPVPQGFSSNTRADAGRLFILVIDQPNIRFGGTASLRSGVNAFIDRLHPSDRVAVVGIGLGSVSTPFSASRERAKETVARLTGQRQVIHNDQYHLAISEAMQVYDGNPMVLQAVASRECTALVDAMLQNCVVGIQHAATVVAQQIQGDIQQTLQSLRAILSSLRLIDAPKTLIFFSEGFMMGDEMHTLVSLGALASEARTTIFSLKLDHDVLDVSTNRISTQPLEDRRLMAEALDVLAGTARGSRFDISAGAHAALAQIETELSGYYLLGLEADPLDSGARRHAVRVDVARRNATVRWRREIVGLGGRTPAANPRQAVVDALRTPLMVSALPLRVATFSLRDPDPSKIQLLIHAEVGEDYASTRAVQLGYTIVDPDGRVVENQMAGALLPPVMDGVPSPLQFKAGASLPAGEYTLKLAVAEGERVGSIEHPIAARLVPAGSVALSELMVGGPTVGRDGLQPTIGHVVSFGVVHGYVEAYGPGAERLQVKYEVARDADAPAVLSAEVPGRRISDERAIFTHLMPVRQLPGGKYILRAVVRPPDGGNPLRTMTRDFEVAPPPVLMTSAEGGGAAAAPTEIFLPVQDRLFLRVFSRDEALRPDVLDVFRARVQDDARPAFDQGVALLAAGDYGKAAVSFKNAVQSDGESTAPLAYLAATFAAAGQDDQATGAWQTALIEGSDLPQIYVWLADALMRRRALVQARTILEEAIAAWPVDVRFAKPMAILYATFGLGREAVRTMERHLVHAAEDVEALGLAVEWIYVLHSSGAVARTRAEDVKTARSYAAAYERLDGPARPLVREWIGALEAGRR
jgi:VWFA-related protein